MCESCQVLNINGINCHELDCPDAWKDYKRECKWCGAEFEPTTEYDDFCSEDCFDMYR